MVDNRTLPVGGFTARYNNLKTNVVEKQLADKGKTATLSVPGGTPPEPWLPPPSATDYSVTVLQVELTKRDRTGTVIENADIKLLMSTDGGAVPALDCKITVDGSKYSIVHVEPLKPGSVTMLYYVYCGK